MASKQASPVSYYLARSNELDDEKKPWLSLFQSLAEIFYTRKMDFTRVIIPGQFLQADVFDNTGQFAAYLCASVRLSMMWPDASRTFTIEPVRRLKGMPGVEEYFRFVTEEMYEAMDNPKAGLQMALMEYFLDTGVFGTGAVAALDGPDDDASLPVIFDAWSVKAMTIAETAQGFVDTVYFKRQLTVRQVVLEYKDGRDSISPKITEAYEAEKYDEKVNILIVIEPKTPEKGKEGIAAMSCRTVHIDVDHQFMMRESGYEEMPLFVGRLFKTTDEPYGRSFGMVAQCDAQSLNILTEAVLVASEKLLDPALAVLDDGRLGGGVIDTSSGAVNVFNTMGRMGNEKPIFPINTVGELNSALEQQKEFKGKVMQAFLLDRLLDLNNQTQMTAYETSVRDRKAGQAAGGVFSRDEKELFTPLIHRVFNQLFRKGYFGIVKTGPGAKNLAAWDKITGGQKMVVPTAIIEAHKAGLDVFEVKYISPAKRFQQAEKLQGIFTAVDAIVALAAVIPGITDNIDGDQTTQDIYAYGGAPKTGLRTKDDLLKFRAANAQKQAETDKLEQGEAASNIALKSAQARMAMGTTGPGPGGK